MSSAEEEYLDELRRLEAKMCNDYKHDDGGRSKTRTGLTGDCAVRALAIVTGMDYEEAYKLCRQNGFKARSGMMRKDYNRVLESLGYVWVPEQAAKGRQRLKLHEVYVTCIARVSKHYVAVVDGVVLDNHDSRRIERAGRCVYGRWVKNKACT